MYERLRRIKETHDLDVSWKEKLLAKDIFFLNSEMNVKKANEKMERALLTLNEIDQGFLCKLKISKECVLRAKRRRN